MFVCFAEIVDGNVKMTLGMIWTIILRFAIQDISVEGVFVLCVSSITSIPDLILGHSANLTFSPLVFQFGIELFTFTIIFGPS